MDNILVLSIGVYIYPMFYALLVGLTLVDSIPIVDIITIPTIVWYEVVDGGPSLQGDLKLVNLV